MTSTVFNYEDPSYSTPLRTAIENNDKKLFISSLKSRASVRLCNNNGWTVLHFAAKFNRVKFMNLLLRKSCDSINIKTHDGKTPLAICSEVGSFNVLRFLLAQKNIEVNSSDNNCASPLHLACINGHLRCVKMLIENGASINAQDLNGLTPLHESVINNHSNICHYLLLSRATPFIRDHFYDFYPLHYSCQDGNLRITNLLLEYMIADPAFNINTTAINNCTPLMLAIRSDNFKLIKELLKHGADVNIATCDGLLPLQIAASHGNFETFKLMYQHTATETILKYFALDNIQENNVGQIYAGKKNLIVSALKTNDFNYVESVLNVIGWEKDILDCPHIVNEDIFSPISFLITQMDLTNNVDSLKQYLTLLLDSGCSLIPNISTLEQHNILNPLYACIHFFTDFSPDVIYTIYHLLKQPPIIESLNNSKYKYFDMGIGKSKELVLTLLQYSDVVEPQDLIIHFHVTIANKDREIVKNVVSALFDLIPVRSDIQNIFAATCSEKFLQIPSLAVFCRQAVRGQLHKETGDNYRLFRYKLTHLDVPQELTNFLNYT